MSVLLKKDIIEKKDTTERNDRTREEREGINTRGIQHIGGHSFNICSIVGYENVGRIVLQWNIHFSVELYYSFVCVFLCTFLTLFK